MANLIFKNAEEAKLAIMVSQQKEIAKLYEDWADEIGDKANYYHHKSTASAPLSERYYRELQRQIRKTSQELSNEIYKKIKTNIYTISDAVVADNVKWLESFGFSSSGLNAAFSYVPNEIVQNLITGQIYESGWSLSSRIWSDNEQTLKDIYQVMAKGLAENKPIYDIAKDLESYVRPNARLPWNMRMADGVKIYKKQVDYNAQRLARTLVQHGYQQSFIATTQKNPFITEYVWISNGSRVCPLCANRDGQHYNKYELPMDHPNGMCTIEPVIDEDMIDKLADWFNSPDGTYPDIDDFAGNFGYEVSKVGTVKDFINKYGMSSKSPSAWFNSLSQIQKSEAKALKTESGLTWNKWYEQNIYNGDGSKLGSKEIKGFNDIQKKYLKPYGFTKDNMPYDFDDWSHKVSYKHATEILKSMYTDWNDPHPYQKLMQFYEKNLVNENFTNATKNITKTTKLSNTFDSKSWHESIKTNNLSKMNNWCKDWLKVLLENEQDAVETYTGDAYYDMNKYLRGQLKTTIYKNDIKRCTDALKKASLSEDVIVRRGSDYNMLRDLNIEITKENKDKMIGSIVTEKGFLSTSPDPDGGFSGSIEYIIKVPKGSQAMYVDSISKHRGEKELLVNRNGKYIIEDIKFDRYGDVRKIYMTLKNLKHKK